MKQMIVDIIKLTDEEINARYPSCKYKIKAYVYELDKVISYGISEEEIQDYYIGKIICYTLV